MECNTCIYNKYEEVNGKITTKCIKKGECQYEPKACCDTIESLIREQRLLAENAYTE